MLHSEDLLGDRYRLDESLASGGMGQVWRATDIVLGRTVAVKVLLPSLLTDPGFAARFRAEARAMAALRHPNVVNVYDYGESTDADGGTSYLVMAYVDGEPLSQRIAAAGRLPGDETMSIVGQAAEALHAAHTSGIVHRDVKPGNLLVQPDGATMLVDFGVARSDAVAGLTTAHAVPGTALYMAPEQASGRPVSAATDVYALGVVAYHCLAGHPPFTGGTPLEIALRHVNDEPPELPADVTAPVRALIDRSMAKDPADRYPTAADFAAAARAAASGSAGDEPTEMARPAAADPSPTKPDLPAGDSEAARGAAGAGGPGAVRAARPAAGATSGQGTGSRRRRLAMAAVAAALLLTVVGVVVALQLARDGGWKSPVEGPTGSPEPAVTAPAQPGGDRTAPPRQTGAPASATVAPPATPTQVSPARPGGTAPPATRPAETPPGQGSKPANAGSAAPVGR